MKGKRNYEISNHLGNVVATITDRHKGYAGTTRPVLFYEADRVMSCDYYAFGSQMEGRVSYSSKARYGFNGMEKDDELKGEGNS